MTSSPQKSCEPHTPDHVHQDAWCSWEGPSCLAAVLGVIEPVIKAMAAEGYAKPDLFGVRLALEEAIVNAFKHGNQGDSGKRVRVRYHVNAERVLVQVEDEGPGFDPHQVPDPLTPDNLKRPGGRGLLLMRTYMNWMRYNARGNCVTMCKRRSAPSAKSVRQKRGQENKGSDPLF
jgi:serine/threonine-protein kinase RsbW